jgi:SPP1 gp7 family putative phage head morphogenesis protein
MMQRGFTVDEAVRTLAREFGERIKPWAYAYGEVVYRTNLNTAYNAGMIRQVRESDTMRRAFPAWEVMGVADGDERENHRPVRGVIAAIESPIWNRFSPPLGYNCRHSFRSVSFDELKRLGLIRRNGTVMAFVPPGPPVDDVVAIRRLVQMGAAPDYPSFGRRPDSMIYG